MIQVVNKYHYEGEGEIVMRPSPLGNPYSHLKNSRAQFIVADRNEAVEKYEEWLDAQPENSPAKQELKRLADKYKQEGKLVLICCCVPVSKNYAVNCHAFIISKKIQEIILRA